jgi:hypothetical protein
MQTTSRLQWMLLAAALLFGVLVEVSTGVTPLAVLDANFAQPKLLDDLNTGAYARCCCERVPCLELQGSTCRWLLF